MFKYRIYGLNVLSDLPMDCFAHDFDKEDLQIRFSKNENEIDTYISQLCIKDNPTVIITPDGSGRIIICGKANILVYYQNDYDLKCSIIHYLLGFVFSYIFYMQKVFLLHGSCIVHNSGATVLIGDSCAGKSSLAAGFAQRGAKILTDDITRIELSAEIPFVYPSFPTHRLRRNTIEHLELDMSAASEIIGESEKYLLYDDSVSVFLNENTPVKSIVYINPVDTGKVQLIKEDIKNSLLVISKNIYNNGIISISDSISDYFSYILMICDKIPIYTLQRPQNSFTIKEQVDIVLKEIYKD